MVEVLMFHRVLPLKEIKFSDAYFIRGTLISQRRLEEVINQYLDEGFTFKTIKTITNNSDEKQVVFTFDDGYLDNYLYAKPILEKYGIKAVFYPIIGYCKEQKVAPLDHYYDYVNKQILNQENKKDWIKGKTKKKFIDKTVKNQRKFIDKLDIDINNCEVSYMTTENLQTLHNLGHEIGGHSYYHDIYPKLTKSEVLNDIKLTKESFLELGINIKSFAFPDGQYNSTSIDLLREEGIEYACVIKQNTHSVDFNYEIARKFVREYDIVQ